MKKAEVGSIRWVFVAALVVGCSKEIVADEASSDGGVDAGSCPEYEPDGGVVVLMRGCPLMIDYAIR